MTFLYTTYPWPFSARDHLYKWPMIRAPLKGTRPDKIFHRMRDSDSDGHHMAMDQYL